MSEDNNTYQDNLDDLIKCFNGRRVLTVSDVSKYTGHSRAWCRNTYAIDSQKGISVPTLARLLSK